MRTKKGLASILAVLLTFLSGSHTIAFATPQKISSSESLSKVALCSGPFTSPFCGKKNECLTQPALALKEPFSSVAFVPQQALAMEMAAAKKDEKKVESSQLAYTYEVALATPTTVQNKAVQSPTPTVMVQSSVAVNPDPGAGLNPDHIFNLVNEVRAQYGLPAFAQDGEICQLASERAPELYNEIFVTGTMHAGLARRQPNIPYWVNENMIHQNTEQQAVNWWMNSPVHRSAILGNYKYACVKCSGNSCAMLFTSYTPK